MVRLLEPTSSQSLALKTLIASVISESDSPVIRLHSLIFKYSSLRQFLIKFCKPTSVILSKAPPRFICYKLYKYTIIN